MSFMADIDVESINEITSISTLLNELLTIIEKKDENLTESVKDCCGAKKRNALLNGCCKERQESHHKRAKRQTTLDEHFFGTAPAVQLKRSSLLSSTAASIKTTFAVTTSGK